VANSEATPGRLSAREQEVQRLVSQGLLNKEIADLLQISEAGVKSHITHILEKLKARNRVEIALIFHGIVPRKHEET
jgi:two-component system, NarL family, nitrate/nitrite response regulator NarL